MFCLFAYYTIDLYMGICALSLWQRSINSDIVIIMLQDLWNGKDHFPHGVNDACSPHPTPHPFKQTSDVYWRAYIGPIPVLNGSKVGCF